jgi:hypothetical protein|tara:strand:- start:1047 stop:1277 length:231 start_codon:yes stop_codon:yes gene_type:complete
MGTIDDLGINQKRILVMKRYGLALLGLILFSSGLCVFGEALISKYENNNWFLTGTISFILINSGLGLMIKNKWGKF